MSRAVMGWLAVLLCFTGAMILFSLRRPTESSHTVAAANPHPDEGVPVAEQSLVDFELTDQEGKNFNSKDLAGQIWVGSIFFADCPSTCRVQNMRISELQREFGDQGVRFVSVTCDPEHDTPERLAEYSRLFSADAKKWHFLTGDLDLIKRIGGEKFGIVVEEVVHSDRLIVFGRDGKIAGTYRSTVREDVEQARKKIAELLAASPTEPSSH